MKIDDGRFGILFLLFCAICASPLVIAGYIYEYGGTNWEYLLIPLIPFLPVKIPAVLILGWIVSRSFFRKWKWFQKFQKRVSDFASGWGRDTKIFFKIILKNQKSS